MDGIGGLGNGGGLARNSGLVNGLGGATSSGIPFNAGMSGHAELGVNHGTGGLSVSRNTADNDACLLYTSPSPRDS